MGLFSKRIEKQIESYQHELIETHYREVDNMYRQIRGWRHDYRNHIQTMKAYAATENWEAIKNYLDLLDEDLTTVDTVIKTGNPMTDAILNSKISLAKSKGIAVVADAHIPVKLKSSEIDLCCIIGNLFDNAIEASVKLPEEQRLIRVYMDMKSTQLYISFTNFTADKKLKRKVDFSAAPREKVTALAWCVLMPLWNGSMAISAAIARTERLQRKYCFRRYKIAIHHLEMTIRPQNHLGTNFCVILCSERMMVLWLRKKFKRPKSQNTTPSKM